MSNIITAGNGSNSGTSISSDTSGILEIKTGSGPTTAIAVNASQNVGIGTSAVPSNKDTVTPKLIVNGSGVAGSMQVVRNTTVGVGGALIELSSTRGSDVNSYTILQSGDGVGSIAFGGADGNEFVRAAAITCQVDGTPGDNDMPGRLVFETTADGASTGTERMRIDSSGNVNIGLTGANNRLAVYGPEATMLVRCSSITDGTGRTIVGFQSNDGSGIGSISGNNSNTAYNTASDYRLKENIAPMVGALDKVAALKPCTYTWKVDGSDGQGFIAHELAEVVPQCVTGEKDAVNEDGSIKPQGIDTSFLVATLTAAIQELKAELDATKAEVAALKGA